MTDSPYKLIKQRLDEGLGVKAIRYLEVYDREGRVKSLQPLTSKTTPWQHAKFSY